MNDNVYNDSTFLAIIPARGGSKGLPGKNIKNLCGKPVIAWSIEAALQSAYINEVMVTTDSNEIADIAKKFGAVVPFLRPKELANDTASTYDVIHHTIEFYKNELNRQFDYIVLLEPTSPLRNTVDINNAVVKLKNNSEADAIVGISKTESQNPAFLVYKNKYDFIRGYEKHDMKVLRRQDIEDVYFFEGSIYISKTDVLLEKKSFYHEKTVAYEVPKWKSLEIDDIDDFIMVEAIMKYKMLDLVHN